MHLMSTNTIASLFVTLVVTFPLLGQEQNESLWKAAKANDVETIKALVENGIDVNAETRYGATALVYAADRGHLETVNLLLENGADVNLKDSFYQSTPLGWAVYKGHVEIIKSMIRYGADLSNPRPILSAAASGHVEVVKLMLENGSSGASQVALMAASNGNEKMLSAVLETVDLNAEILSTALLIALSAENKEIIDTLKNAGAKLPEKNADDMSGEMLAKLAGTFADQEGSRVKLEVKEDRLVVSEGWRGTYNLISKEDNRFKLAEVPDITIAFELKDGKVTGFDLIRGENTTHFSRVEVSTATNRIESKTSAPIDEEITVEQVKNWTSFRGEHASGIADGQHPPIVWDAEKAINIRWKTPIPGLAHSSPIVSENKIFVTTAISSDTAAEYRVGLYGDVDPAKDVSFHRWRLYCLDKNSGRILWDKTAYEGVPRVKRHMKATQANSTPATNGKYVTAVFGSEGLVCYDLDGNLQWKNDLGILDAGWFYDEEIQWGHGSSPIIYKNLVIVQCDRSKDSHIAAYDIKSGKEAWKTERDEIPSWGTPTVYYGSDRDEIITNASRFIRGYDPKTGRELWRLSPNSEITVATPITMDDLIFVTGGYPPVRPIYAVKPGGTGDISLPDSLNSGEFIRWRTKRGGTYIPTPIAYGGLLYTLSNNGILACYDAMSGERKYKQRVAGRGGYAFAASPVAADGKIYVTSEEGIVFVVKAGPEFELVTQNSVGEICMATPAISDGMIFIRGQNHLFGIGRQ